MKLLKTNYFLIILIINIFTIKSNAQKIPINVSIEAFVPKGLKISINNVIDSTYFELNANLNKKLEINDVPDLRQSSSKPTNEKWVVYFPDVVTEPNDVIYFWFVIVVNDHQYFYKNGSKTIRDKDIKQIPGPRPITIYREPPRERPREQPREQPRQQIREQPSEQCTCVTDFETQREIESLKKQHENIRKELDYVKEILFQVTKDTSKDRYLLLTGRKPPGFNPLQEVRQFIIDKLKLYEFEYEIAQARYSKCGILFEMTTDIQKKVILSKSGQLLQQSVFKVHDPKDYNCKETNINSNTKTNFDPTIDVRLGF